MCKRKKTYLKPKKTKRTYLKPKMMKKKQFDSPKITIMMIVVMNLVVISITAEWVIYD